MKGRSPAKVGGKGTERARARAMPRKRSRDPIPESFSTLEQAAEFWDHHDLADYHDQTSAVTAEVKIERPG